MKRMTVAFTLCCAFGLALMLTSGLVPLKRASASAQPWMPWAERSTGAQDSGRMTYADFENVQDKRPLSNHGGVVQLISYEERPTLKSRYKGAEQSDAPELVRLKKDDPNRAIAFDYELLAPNDYAGVGVEIHGQPDKDGKPVADDVSAYKNLELQVYETGVPSMRLEFTSRGQGIAMSGGYPQTTFKVKPGFNTYKIPLNSLLQPSWAEVKVSTKDVLKKLTSISLVAYCDKCTPIKGTVIVDNIVFTK
jgi:hypothetical protein